MRMLLLAAAAVAALGFAGAADAATATSSNWSGYSVSGTGQTFTDVKGSWVQPAPTCAPRTSSYSSYWVGLGGSTTQSTGLEQIGTAADCRNGVAANYAWYELVPAPPVTIPLAPFGTAAFSAASTTANGHTGVISDAAWTSTSIALHSVAGGASATPSALGADGASFTVTTTAPSPVVTPPTARRVWWGGGWRPHHRR